MLMLLKHILLLNYNISFRVLWPIVIVIINIKHMKNISYLKIKILFIFLSLFCILSQGQVCQYTCATCYGSQYYQCLTCPSNRGSQTSFEPVAGMCYCTFSTDQDNSGACTNTVQYNRNNKSVIAAFIALALFFTVVGSLITGLRHFLLKTIQDVQQISIIVFINLYFPQQFDIFLTYLYRFNISSYTFQSVARGSLFSFDSSNLVQSNDGQNIYGKYKLLYKTANFFANQFTWLIVFVCFIAFALILRFVRNRVKGMQNDEKCRNQNKRLSQMSMESQGQGKLQMVDSKLNTQTNQAKILPSNQQQTKYSCLYRWINIAYNFTWLNFFIIFFYLSLIEININIFTQIGNLTFSSPFAAVGAFFSALFLALEIVILGMLALKIRQQTIKPQWMRDYTYTAAIYLIRTNYKTVTKYFWFFSCIKKILLALMITVLYSDPSSAILGISSVQIIFLCFAVYCEPFERRYIRIHFYATESMKLFLYVCLINFTEQYVQYARMIELTKILYFMLAFFFGFNFFYILINMFAERDMYVRAWIRRFYPQSESKYMQGKLGYHSEGKLFVYERE